MLKWISFVVTFVSFFSFAWSVIGVFKTVSEIQVRNQLALKAASVVTWLWILFEHYRAESSETMYLVNTLIQILCLVFFWKTSEIAKRNSFTVVFSNDIPNRLVKEGPYKYIRHPFYTIYLVSYISSAVIVSNVVVLLAPVLMTFLYIFAAKTEEKKFSRSSIDAEYAVYKTEAGMFWPKFK